MAEASVSEDHPFPWHLGVYDAHCHPTDTVASLGNIAGMKTKALTIMATRRQDQRLVARFTDELGYESVLEKDRYIIPAFGWHPWFSHQVYDDLASHVKEAPSKEAHYAKVVTPAPDNQTFVDSLPEPRSLSGLLQEIRAHLAQYPLALVGEVGLDRAFRIPGTEQVNLDYEPDPALTPGSREGRKLSRYRVDMEHQQRILTTQLNLAGEMQRAVSVHGVAAHGIVYETLSSTWRGHEMPSKRERKRRASAVAAHEGDDEQPPPDASNALLIQKPYPPRMCLHSYSGPPDTLRIYLQPSVPATIFFSFSHLVNFSSASNKAIDVIKAVPDDRILAESDLHAAGDRMDELMEDIMRNICHIKGWSLEHGVSQIASNWKHFVFGKC